MMEAVSSYRRQRALYRQAQQAGENTRGIAEMDAAWVRLLVGRSTGPRGRAVGRPPIETGSLARPEHGRYWLLVYLQRIAEILSLPTILMLSVLKKQPGSVITKSALSVSGHVLR